MRQKENKKRYLLIFIYFFFYLCLHFLSLHDILVVSNKAKINGG